MSKLETKSFLKLFEGLSFESQNEALDKLLKNKKFYILFKVSEAGNSDDINYELDYMFKGVYTSYEAAYKYAIDEILEQADENDDNSKLEHAYENINTIDREELDEILEGVEWKIIERKILYKMQTPQEQIFTLKFGEHELPTDQNIHDNCYTGILDTASYDVADLLQNWLSVSDRVPKCDKNFYQPDEEKLAIAMEDSMRKLKELQHRDIPINHDCDDPNCPHLAKVHPLEMLSIKAGLLDPSLFVLDFTKWKPFDYPILSIDNNGLQKLSIATYKLKNVPNAFRVIYNCKLNLQNEYVVPRDFDFVEALYFTGENISDFTFSVNSSDINIKPTRKYNFLGLGKQGCYSIHKIAFTKETTFAIIAWIFMDRPLYKLLKSSHIISTYENQFTIEHKNQISKLIKL